MTLGHQCISNALALSAPNSIRGLPGSQPQTDRSQIATLIYQLNDDLSN
jgi:hypothetical protein